MPVAATPFVFQRFAGSLQARVRSWHDVLALRHLPEVHWVALACPIDALTCDRRFLTGIDRDGNGRVRVREVLEAIEWVDTLLVDHSDCVPGSDVLSLDHLAPAAAQLRQTAELVLDNLRSSDRTRISLEQVRQNEKILGQGAANGDGIIGPESISDPALKNAVVDLLALYPGAADKTGERGVDQATVKEFRAARAKAVAWLDQRGDLFAWGERSLEKAKLAHAVRPRLDEYFLECRMVATQPEIAGQFKMDKERLADALGQVERMREALATLPIAPPDPACRLRWADLHRSDAQESIERFRREVCAEHVPGGAADGLDEAQWRALIAIVDPLIAWSAKHGEHPVLEKIGPERVRSIDETTLGVIDGICLQDLKLGEVLARIGELERLILHQRWLFMFVNNFVSMPHLYRNDHHALFAQGTLFISGREFSFAVLVPNRAAHAAFSADSAMYTMYLEISGGNPGRTFEIAVPVTAGTSSGLFVGKRGVFRAIDGQEYDAVIVQLVIQPVSLYEAMTQPFTRITRFFTSRIEKFSGQLDKDFDKHVDSATAPGTPPPPVTPVAPAARPNQPPAAAGGGMGNILMGGSVAFAAISSGFAVVVSQLSNIKFSQLLYGLVVVCTLIAVPTSILAWLKLRRRNLAVVLEASGWALNDRLHLTRALGKLFTRRPRRPAGSRTELADQVGQLLRLRKRQGEEEEEEPSRRNRWAVAIAIVLVLLLGASLWWWQWGPSQHAATLPPAPSAPVPEAPAK